MRTGEKMNNDAVNRKARSVEILKQYGVPYIEHLPVIETKEEVKIRTAEEIAQRAIACLIAIQMAFEQKAGENIEGGREFAVNLLETFQVTDCLTEDERLILYGEPVMQDIINMAWKYEAYWVLLWALGIVEELSFPSNICDCEFAIEAVSKHNSFEEFMGSTALRDIDEILDENDLIFRYNWACVDARIKGHEAPSGLDSSVVLERHKALNWLIDFDENDDWDGQSTNT